VARAADRKGKNMHPTFIYKGVRTDIAMLTFGGEWTLPLWWKVLKEKEWLPTVTGMQQEKFT